MSGEGRVKFDCFLRLASSGDTGICRASGGQRDAMFTLLRIVDSGGAT